MGLADNLLRGIKNAQQTAKTVQETVNKVKNVDESTVKAMMRSGATKGQAVKAATTVKAPNSDGSKNTGKVNTNKPTGNSSSSTVTPADAYNNAKKSGANEQQAIQAATLIAQKQAKEKAMAEKNSGTSNTGKVTTGSIGKSTTGSTGKSTKPTAQDIYNNVKKAGGTDAQAQAEASKYARNQAEASAAYQRAAAVTATMPSTTVAIDTKKVEKSIEQMEEVCKDLDTVRADILKYSNESAVPGLEGVRVPINDYWKNIEDMKAILDDVKKTDAYVNDLCIQLEVAELEVQMYSLAQQDKNKAETFTTTFGRWTNVIDDTTVLENLETYVGAKVSPGGAPFETARIGVIDDLMDAAASGKITMSNSDFKILQRLKDLGGNATGGVVDSAGKLNINALHQNTQTADLSYLANKYGMTNNSNYKALNSYDDAVRATKYSKGWKINNSSIKLNSIMNGLGDTAITTVINKVLVDEMVKSGEITELDSFAVECGMNFTDVFQNIGGTVLTVGVTDLGTAALGATTKGAAILAAGGTGAALAGMAIGVAGGTIVMVGVDLMVDGITNVMSGGEYTDFKDLGKDFGDALINTKREVEQIDAQCNVEMRGINALRKAHGLEPIPIYDLEGNLIE